MKKIAVISIALLLSTKVFSQQPQTGDQPQREVQQPRREVKWVNPEIPDIPGLSHHILQSKKLGHEVGYVVWTPEDYSEKAKKRFPVIFFLHGSGGNETSDAAPFSERVKQAIAEKTIPPVICVFPNGGRSGYRDEVEKMIIEELIPEVDKNYRTLASPKSRALTGFSMGGAGSVYLAIKHPELFCAAASMGGGIRNQDGELDSAIEEAIPVWKKNKFGFFFVNGDQDRPEAFKDFSALLDKEGISNTVVILPDANHNLKLHYFPRSGNQLIAFIGDNLKK
jgi:enterochelin esterase-like enzyme